jgi:S1-C subfamily serine protease
MRIDYASAFLDAAQPMQITMPGEAVIVSEVEANTPAAAAGVKRGMLISQVDGRPVGTPRDFRAAVAEKSGAVKLNLGTTDPSNAVIVVPPGS